MRRCGWSKVRCSTGAQHAGMTWRGAWWLIACRGWSCRAFPVRYQDSLPDYRCLWIIIKWLGDTRGRVRMILGRFKLG
jgi:hypothetical protein